MIRLIDGTRAYLHAVIDNFSRRILARSVSGKFDVTNTYNILDAATNDLETKGDPPTLLVDGGGESHNPDVDDLVTSGRLHRLLAMTESMFSNSTIESWFRAIKHQWLFLNTIDTVASVRKLVEFYVDEHNTRLPHSTFQGQTPDEIYFGTVATFRTSSRLPELSHDSSGWRRTDRPPAKSVPMFGRRCRPRADGDSLCSRRGSSVGEAVPAPIPLLVDGMSARILVECSARGGGYSRRI